MVVMAVSGLNTALPRIQEDLGASSTQLQYRSYIDATPVYADSDPSV
jgi:hypothetical protein